ncbi:MAG: hypothetical protein JRD93_07000 [Deltaproteobacteria bacterium]|nr:hypothetical protein [Deltaproteobacteria bacterium]MBW2661722.1 hypothetical protein [Deltaproteobacteria bacterium]
MSFKQNLLKKIKIDKMTGIILNSIVPSDSGRRIDKKTMRNLLEMGQYQLRHERDLDLYLLKSDSGMERILVLDNELAIYAATVEDIVLRKSPIVKEMLNIRNIIKILNDSDVIVSKKEESVRAIQKECLTMLNLSFNASDIEEIEKDGIIAMEMKDVDAVIESLSLFAELLGYNLPPKSMQIEDYHIIGALSKKEGGEIIFGPIVIYSLTHNFLKLIDRRISNFDKEKIELIYEVATGKERASKEGHDVFRYLKEEVVKQKL